MSYVAVDAALMRARCFVAEECWVETLWFKGRMGREAEGGRRWIMGLLLLGATGTALLGRVRGCAGAGVTPVAERGAARELVVPELGGGEWRLSGHRGEVVLVNLWATWCGPCREETPEMVRMAREDRDLAVLGISLDEGADAETKVRAFAREYGVRYPLGMGGAGLAGVGGVESIPTTMLFDRAGRLAKVYVGAFGRGVIQRDVTTLAGEH